MRDMYGNLVKGEYNAATGQPLGASDPMPSRIKTPSIASATSGVRARMPGTGGMVGPAVARMAGTDRVSTAAAPSPGRLGSPMWSIPESASPVSEPRAPGQSISRAQIAYNQTLRNGMPSPGRVLSPTEAASTATMVTRQNPDGTRSVAGTYGSGSTVAPSIAKPQPDMVAKASMPMEAMTTKAAPASGRNAGFPRPTSEPVVAATKTTEIAKPVTTSTTPAVSTSTVTRRGMAMPAPAATTKYGDPIAKKEEKRKMVVGRGRVM